MLLYIGLLIAGFSLGRAEGKTYNNNYTVHPILDMIIGAALLLGCIIIIVFP